ncbi:MAG: hypothetical protein R3F54_01120 [Alphaproteobacteria bacterium]
MRHDARTRRRQDLAGLGAHGDGRRNADEDEKRRHQEAAPDAENARQKADGAAHTQQQEQIDRYLGHRQVDIHQML